QTQLVHTERSGDTGKSLNLLERENLPPRQKPHIFIRHAIKAPDVAAIRDTNPQIRVHAAQRIDKWFVGHLLSRPGCTHSFDPSAQFSHFQMGTTSLIVSINHCPAAKASARCGELTAMAMLASPSSKRPRR